MLLLELHWSEVVIGENFMKRAIILLIFIISLGLFVGGCEKEESMSEDPVTILAILLGNHANSRKFNIQLNEKIEQVYTSFGNICIICVDGNPEVVMDNENSKMMAGSYGEDYLKKSREDYQYKEIWQRDYLEPQVTKLKNYLEKSCVDDPEVDTLEAFHNAIVALNEMEEMIDSDKKVNKEIIVFDTGLCTAGKLNFLNYNCLKVMKNDKILYKDDIGKKLATDLVDELEANAEIPDLSEITVTWYGLGSVDKPQLDLSHLDRENLRYIWSEILKRAKAAPAKAKNVKSDYFVEMKGYETEVNEQYVTPVIWWEGVGDTDSEEEVKIEEEEIGFIANSAEYSSTERANQILGPYARNLLNYADLKILLLGTTSSYNGGSIELSKQRAEKVKESLMELGIPEERMVTVGVGYNQEFCENDSPNGEFVEEIGKKNRAVFMLPLYSEKSQKVLGKSY